MAYFKVVQDNQITDAGSVFLRWSTKWQQLFACDVEDAQFVQSNKEILYRDEWMRPCSEGVDEIIDARVVAIEADEYDEIRALLDDDQIIEIPVEEYPVEVEPEPIEPEKQKTITEMRELIKTQQEQIEMLTGCILEISEMVYGEE